MGDSNLKLSVLAFGAWGIGGGKMWGNTETAEAVKTLHSAYDVGINFFDTAYPYGDGFSEEILGKALADRRSEVLLSQNRVKKPKLNGGSSKSRRAVSFS